MSKKQKISRERNKKSKGALFEYEQNVLKWLQDLNPVQVPWEEWQETRPCLWPGTVCRFPEIVLEVSAYVPPLPGEGDYEEPEPIEWEFCLINAQNTKWQLHRKYQTKEDLTRASEELYTLLRIDHRHDWQWYAENFEKTEKKMLTDSNPIV